MDAKCRVKVFEDWDKEKENSCLLQEVSEKHKRLQCVVFFFLLTIIIYWFPPMFYWCFYLSYCNFICSIPSCSILFFKKWICSQHLKTLDESLLPIPDSLFPIFPILHKDLRRALQTYGKHTSSTWAQQHFLVVVPHQLVLRGTLRKYPLSPWA